MKPHKNRKKPIHERENHRLFGEFKQFIARGNVMDMAVGVIIGGAFSNITNSLINDIVMPVLGIFTSSVSFAELTLNIGPAVVT